MVLDNVSNFADSATSVQMQKEKQQRLLTVGDQQVITVKIANPTISAILNTHKHPHLLLFYCMA